MAFVEKSREQQVTVSSAFLFENVASHGAQADVDRIAAAGPRGAIALASLSVAVMLAIWLAFYLFIYLPRGSVG